MENSSPNKFSLFVKKLYDLNYSEESELKMKKKIKSKLPNTIRYRLQFLLMVYQTEADGKALFEYIRGDEKSIMGLPIKQIKKFMKNYK